MKTRCITAAIAAAALAMGGCTENGLSTRENPHDGLSAYTYSLYDSWTAPGEAAPMLRLPGSVAVAQIGEVAPPSWFLDEIQQKPGMFTRVQSLPSLNVGPGEQGGSQMGRMIDLARGMGMDYLLIFGGTIDADNNDNGLSLMDLTIVGAMVVPSRDLRAEARGSAALIEVRSRKVVLLSSAEATENQSASSSSAEARTLRMQQSIRDEVLHRLAANFVKDCQAQAVAAPVPPR